MNKFTDNSKTHRQLISKMEKIYNFKTKGKNIKIYESAKIIMPEVIEIGDYTEIGDFAFIYSKKGIKIGRYVHISRFVSIIGMGELILGDYTVLADGTRVLTSTDSYEGGSRMSSVLPLEQRNIKITTVRIEKDAFVGFSLLYQVL